jgi:hypothetical protein
VGWNPPPSTAQPRNRRSATHDEAEALPVTPHTQPVRPGTTMDRGRLAIAVAPAFVEIMLDERTGTVRRPRGRHCHRCRGQARGRGQRLLVLAVSSTASSSTAVSSGAAQKRSRPKSAEARERVLEGSGLHANVQPPLHPGVVVLWARERRMPRVGGHGWPAQPRLNPPPSAMREPTASNPHRGVPWPR